MSTAARLAYGYARVRARKAGLLRPEILVALVGADAPALTIPGWSDLDAAGADGLTRVLFQRLIDDYAVAIRGYPDAAAALLALLRLHEIENVKLAWRVAVPRTSPALRTPVPAGWRPLGALQTFSVEMARSAGSLRGLVTGLGRTPYARIADSVFSSHAGDLAAAELAFDRWASASLLTEANRLHRAEHVARDLLCGVVSDRDRLVAGRARDILGLPPEAAAGLTALGGRPHRGKGRRDACRRAFLDRPFTLAPPVALVLLREDETRALLSVAELRARHASPAEAQRVLNASA